MNGESFVDWTNRISKLIDHGRNEQRNSKEFIVEEIGDGNLNDVHRIISTEDWHRSLIIKHALPYIKCLGPDFPLSVNRSTLEYHALQYFDSIAPGSVPKPYSENREKNSFLMEDLRGYGIMRKGLMRGELDLEAARGIVRHIKTIHQRTTAKYLEQEKFDKLLHDFRNIDMTSLTCDYIFTKPFTPYNATNTCSSAVASHLDLIYKDEVLLKNAADLRTIFCHKHECLQHGDLHTGSLMTHGTDAKMIDLEFAFVGPMAFDLGILLANYIFSYHAHGVSVEESKFQEQVRRAAVDAISEYLVNAEGQFTPDEFLTLVREVVGFTGCELVRRIIGAAHVEDLENNSQAELRCLQLGAKLILEYKNINFDEVVDLQCQKIKNYRDCVNAVIALFFTSSQLEKQINKITSKLFYLSRCFSKLCNDKKKKDPMGK